MRVLQVHVFYTTSLTSGENSTVETIGGYLTKYATAETLIVSVARKDIGLRHSFEHYWGTFIKTLKLVLNHRAYDVIFFHNQVPFIPAFLLKYFSRHTLVVKVWHNLRPFCIKGSAFRANQICWKCSSSKGRKLNAIRYRCYRNSLWQTLVAMASQRGLLSILKSPQVYNVAVSDFIRDKLITLGFHDSRVFSIQNAVSSLEVVQSVGSDFLFMGRITEEKGIEKLLSAWEYFRDSNYGDQKLHIVGDGPLLFQLREKYQDSRTIFYGHLKFSEISTISSMCKIGIIPNLWEEPFGKVALDYLSLGLFILATKTGGLTEILSNDSGTEFISSMEPELLAKQMKGLSLKVDPIDLSLRNAIFQRFSRDATAHKWFMLLQLLEESARIRNLKSP